MNEVGAPLPPLDPSFYLVSFRTIHGFCEALSAGRDGSDDGRHEARDARRLFERGLPPITSLNALALLLGVHPAYMMFLQNGQRRHYRRFTIRMGAKERGVAAPRSGLKTVQRYVARTLSTFHGHHDSVHGFRAGRSILTGAAPHCDKAWIWSLDIQDFFPSITRDMVRTALVEIGFPPAGAEAIANVCTFEGQLPQGAPSSPVLSNLCSARMDRELAALADAHQWTYTRYADDLTFSGQGTPPDDLPVAVQSVLNSFAFQLNDRKSCCMTERTGRVVLGLSVHADQPRLGKKMRDKVRHAQFVLNKADEIRISSADQQRFAGLVSYARMIPSQKTPGAPSAESPEAWPSSRSS
jgi:RNA-directed DNA polymerase